MSPAIFTVDSAGLRRSAGRPWRIAAAILVSLLLHALLLYGPRWHRVMPVQQREQASALPPLTVWLVPPPKLKPTPVAVVEPTPTASETNRTRPARVKTLAAPVVTQAPPVMTSVAPATPPLEAPAPAVVDSAPPAPRFNLDAALSTARSVANERDPAKVNTAVGQIPDKPLKSESDLARGIGSAARPNCKDGLPGGLLAPIFLLLDKKDSGCKW